MNTKSFPVMPTVRLPPEVTMVARYLSAYYGLHEGVTLAAVLTAAGALAGDSRSIFWRDGILGLNLQVLLTPPAVAETAGWLELITAPLAAEVARLRKAGGDQKALEAAVGRAVESINSMASDHPGRAVAVETLKRIGELTYPHLFVAGLPTPQERDALRSTLLADASGTVLRTAISELSEADLLRLVADNPNTEAPSRLAFLLVAPAEAIAGIKSGDLLPNWCPLIMPQSGGAFAAPEITRDAAQETWARVVKKLLGVRRSQGRGLNVSSAGEAALNAVKSYAEGAAARVGQTKWFSWPVAACAKLAAILHVLNSDQDCDPSAETWNDALNLAQWLVEMQVRSVGGFTARMRGVKPRYHPPRPTDMEKMKALMRERPTATYRELVWGLPKRPPGHWRKHHVFAKGSECPPIREKTRPDDAASVSSEGPTSPTCATSPTHPTPSAV